jgi:predicted Zn-dependent protease
MDRHTAELTGSVVSAAPGADGAVADELTCPECDAPAGALPAISTSLLRGEPLRRCLRCGTRFGVGAAGQIRRVVTCRKCCLPFVVERLAGAADQRCPECRSGEGLAEASDEAVIRAAEAELRRALDERLLFVGGAGLDTYLDRIVRSLAQCMEDAPGDVEVLICRDSREHAFALPSNVVVLSTGMLASLEDEAELAFVLARELVHLARGDAGIRTARVGLASAAGAEADWSDVARDLIRFGYGGDREFAADAAALEMIGAVGYETDSALRYLERLASRAEAADASCMELVLSTPPPRRRWSRIEARIRGRGVEGHRRTNREPFRRVAGRSVLESGMTPSKGHPLLGPVKTGTRRWLRPMAWLGLAAALLAALLLVVRGLFLD